MTRRWLKKNLPTSAECRRRLGLVPAHPGELANTLSERLGRWMVGLFDKPALWHLNRRSVAGAVAVGLFVGWLPLPGQMLIAALLAAVVRVHVPLSVVMVWFTNPLTVAPLGYVAWRAGSMLLDEPEPREPSEASIATLLAQLGDAWPVLLTGSLFCAVVSAAIGFTLTLLVWRILTVRRWRRRGGARVGD